MRSLRLRAYVAASTAALGVYVAAPAGLAKDIVYVAIGLLCVVAIAVGLRVHRPPNPAVWWLMLAGQMSWSIGDAILSWLEDVAHTPAFPSVGDAFYLAGYLPIALGLVLLVGQRVRRRDLGGVLDSTVITASLGLLEWVLIGRPSLDAADHDALAASVSVAYPLMNVLLVAGLVRLVMTPGARTASFRMLLLAVSLLVVGDTTYAALSLSGSASGLVNLTYVLSYLVWGAAALHPSVVRVSDPGATDDLRYTGRRLAVLAVAGAVAPGVLAVQAVVGVPVDVWAVVIGSIVLFGLVLARMHLAIRLITAAQREREQLQADLLYQASHDTLTGLPNRAQAVESIASALGRAQRGGFLVGLLFVDLDGFKNVNDNFGHAAGDEVLQATARRLHDQVRTGDMVARLGGDEFVVLLEHFDTENDALVIAQRLVSAASVPITTSRGASVRIGASVGMAIAQDGSLDPDRLLHEADAAVYRAKHAGRGRVEVFGEGLRRELTERSEFDAALERAIDDDELVVHYQPIMDVTTGRIRGYEALVRWQRPGHGLLVPADFIPAAERSMLVCDLDVWVLRQACRQLADWTREMAAGFTVAVNISGRHLSAPRIVDDVRNALAETGLAADRLVLEITETMLLEDLLALDHLQQLREIGVAISIDDFGTGYNSIARLRHLPVDILKIDRSFLDADASTLALLKLMIEAAHSLKLSVVVEGVEHAEQLDILRDLNCESAQGFHLAEPLPADEIAEDMSFRD